MLQNEKNLFENLNKFNNLEFLVGNISTAIAQRKLSPMQPFHEEIISFLNDLSKNLLKKGKDYSDVVTFGFWCRQNAILHEKKKYDDLESRLGRGIVFHSTPSNVPVNFAFSFAAGLIAGNANIVRLPAKEFPQVKIICEVINELLETHPEIQPYVCMVKYPPNKEITDIFSQLCDSRVIWGGDETIKELRQSPLRARAIEITFADRHSIAAIDATEYLKIENKDAIAQNFYNDTFFSDQNACTAPRIIIWTGKRIAAAKIEFWKRLESIVTEKYLFKPVQAVSKLHAFYKAAIDNNIELIPQSSNMITRINVKKLTEDLMNYKSNSGFFFEYDAESLDEILPVCDQRCQTLTYIGFKAEVLRDFFHRCRPFGVDRVVPVGKSMDFSLIWDGYDLIRSFSRIYTII